MVLQNRPTPCPLRKDLATTLSTRPMDDLLCKLRSASKSSDKQRQSLAFDILCVQQRLRPACLIDIQVDQKLLAAALKDYPCLLLVTDSEQSQVFVAHRSLLQDTLQDVLQDPNVRGERLLVDVGSRPAQVLVSIILTAFFGFEDV